MKVMIVFQVVIAIADIVAAKAFLRQGIFGLFFTVLIFGAFYKLSYHCILIYTFLSIFFSVIFLVYIYHVLPLLYRLQRGPAPDALDTHWSKYYLAVACISFVYYLFNSIFYFYPYREFKSIEYLENPVFSEMMMDSAVEKNNP